ncbi:hypothetical protein JCM14469_23810 [Desulfatiferula olefinivorans]
MKQVNVFKGVFMAAMLSFVIAWGSCGKKTRLEDYVPDAAVSIPQESVLIKSAAADGVDAVPEIFVQMGHTDDGYTANTVAAFTPDGHHVVTGSKDRTIRLWETESGREVKIFRCRDEAVYLAVSPDGRYLAGGSRNRGSNITIWDMITSKVVQTFSIDVINGAPVVFLPDGKRLLGGGNDGLIRLWDIASGRVLREYPTEIYGDVYQLVLTPDGKNVVAAYRGYDEDKAGKVTTIRVWDIETGENTLSMNTGHVWTVALCLTPDGRALFSSDWGQSTVTVWDMLTGDLIRSLENVEASAIDISANGTYALFGGYMQAHLIELATGKKIRSITTGIHDWVESIRFSPDGRFALVGDQVPRPGLWDLESGTRRHAFGGYSGEVVALGLTGADDTLVAAYGNSRMAAFWDIRNGMMVKRVIDAPAHLINDAAVSPDGRKAAFSGWDMETRNACVSIWDTVGNSHLVTLYPKEPMSVHAQSPVWMNQGRRIAWAIGGSLIISDSITGDEIKHYRLGFSDIRSIATDPSERFFLVLNGLRETLLVDADTGALVKTFKNALGAFGRNGKTLHTLSITSNTIGEARGTDLDTLTETYSFSFGFQGTVREDYATTYIDYYNDIKQLTAGRDGGSLFFADTLNHAVYHIDVNKKKVTPRFKGHTDTVTRLAVTADGRFLCSSGHDGTTRLWDPETGAEVIRFVAFSDGEWIAVTPDGHFSASVNGAGYVNVRVGNRVYSIDQFAETFYDPAYVAAVLHGKKKTVTDDIRSGVSLPPAVAIDSPADQLEVKTDEITVTVSARDMGGGIDGIRLYHNGKAVGEDRRAILKTKAEDDPVVRKTYTLTLTSGQNALRAVGFSRDRIESAPADISVFLRASEKKSTLYVLSVGINRYKNPALNLNYAVPDARAVADFFKEHGDELFKTVEVSGLYDETATRETLVSRMNDLSLTQPQDAVVIYLAGHGENIGDAWYFLPHELIYPEREDWIKDKALSSGDLADALRTITARKVLVLIDACKAGAALTAFRGFEDRKALAQLSRAAGVHVVAASTRDQLAAEVTDLGHGVFTHTLLEGLSGRAAGPDSPVTVRKLMAYIEETLPEMTLRYRQEAQFPVVDSRGMDFPLVKGKR